MASKLSHPLPPHQAAAGTQCPGVPLSFLEALEGCFLDVFKTSLPPCNLCLILLLSLILPPAQLPPRWPLSVTLLHPRPLSPSGQFRVLPTFPFPGSLVPGKAGEDTATLLWAAFVSLALKELYLNTESHSFSNISISS